MVDLDERTRRVTNIPKTSLNDVQGHLCRT